MNVETGSEIQASVAPPHVPPQLVKDFDFDAGVTPGLCPYEGWGSLHGGPRAFFNLKTLFNFAGPGMWVLTRAEDIRAGLQRPDVFSSRHTVDFSMLAAEAWPLIPLELDPPDHSQFRTLLNGIFSPNRMRVLEHSVRTRAVALIDSLAPKRECEFVEAFGRPFPVSVFMQLMGLPEEHTAQFNAWEFGLLHSDNPAEQVQATKEIANYLRELIGRRKIEPADDLITFCVTARVEGRPVADDEILGMCFLLFIAGLDTVAAALSLHFRHLAQNPQHQARLRADPSLIPTAVEELLRRYSTISSTRIVSQDVEFAGVQMKTGDRVLFSTIMANLDPAEFERPMDLDLGRSPNRHVAFSSGPHRCIGSHLARRELVIAMEEWLKRLPTFHIREGVATPVQPRGVLNVHALPLEW